MGKIGVFVSTKPIHMLYESIATEKCCPQCIKCIARGAVGACAPLFPLSENPACIIHVYSYLADMQVFFLDSFSDLYSCSK